METARTPCRFLRATGSRTIMLMLRNKWGIIIYRPKTTVLADFAAARFGEAVEAQAVLLGVDFSQQATLQFFKLHDIDLALEYRFLHALAGAFADLGNSPQAAPASTGFGIHVVANNDQHGFQRARKGR